jgi:hypothetical protein
MASRLAVNLLAVYAKLLWPTPARFILALAFGDSRQAG